MCYPGCMLKITKIENVTNIGNVTKIEKETKIGNVAKIGNVPLVCWCVGSSVRPSVSQYTTHDDAPYQNF